jgi:hypothetical protein
MRVETCSGGYRIQFIFNLLDGHIGIRTIHGFSSCGLPRTCRRIVPWRKKMRLTANLFCILGVAICSSCPANAASFSFSTGLPDGKIGTGSRPSGPAGIEIESADDFILGSPTILTNVSFYGLVPTSANLSDISEVRVEIYRVFPKDSADPPSGNVPTRMNSPSDIAFAERDNAGVGGLTFSVSVVSPSLTAANSVLNGINPKPGQFTGGEGPVTGQEILFDVNLTTPVVLPADHYFIVPQVLLSTGDNFFWLSAPKPIVAPGQPFSPDLQSWIRNENLAPDWLRIGTDITGQGPFNAAFSISGQSVPEPGTAGLLIGGAVMMAGVVRRRAAGRGR